MPIVQAAIRREPEIPGRVSGEATEPRHCSGVLDRVSWIKKHYASAQVIDSDSRPIVGLYAVGNDAASVMGGTYPGAGTTIGQQ